MNNKTKLENKKKDKKKPNMKIKSISTGSVYFKNFSPETICWLLKNFIILYFFSWVINYMFLSICYLSSWYPQGVNVMTGPYNKFISIANAFIICVGFFVNPKKLFYKETTFNKLILVINFIITIFMYYNITKPITFIPEMIKMYIVIMFYIMGIYVLWDKNLEFRKSENLFKLNFKSIFVVSTIMVLYNKFNNPLFFLTMPVLTTYCLIGGTYFLKRFKVEYDKWLIMLLFLLPLSPILFVDYITPYILKNIYLFTSIYSAFLLYRYRYELFSEKTAFYLTQLQKKILEKTIGNQEGGEK